MQARRRSGSAGCLIAIAVVVGLALVCAGVLTFVGYRISQTPAVQRGASIFSATIGFVVEAMRAPGTAAMRRAGCQQALVFSPDLMRRFLESVVPDGGVSEAPQVPMIVCAVQRGQPVPSCEDAVRAYATEQAQPASEIAVRVGVQHEDEARCEGMYAPDGTRLGDVDAGLRRTFGQVGARATRGM